MMSNKEIDDVEATVEEQGEIEEFLNVDNFLGEVVGSHGLWQWLIILYLLISTPAPSSLPVYVNNYPPFRCRMEDSVEDYIKQNRLSFTDVAERIGPWSSSANTGNPSAKNAYGCSRYQLNWSSVNLSVIFNIKTPISLSSNTTEKCPLGYVFSESKDFYPGNMAKDFDIICDNTHLQSLGTAIYMFGMLIGFFLGGWSGDRFGRRITLTVASAIEIAATIVVSVAPNYAVYVVFRCVVAIGNTVKVSLGSVLAYEITLARYRTMYGAVLMLGLNFVFRAYMALCAYLIPNWRALNAALMCTGALGFLYPLILPESPRWLISQKHLRKAIDQLHRGCQINQRRRKVIEEEYFDQLRDKAEQIEEKTKPMRTKCSCSCKGCGNALWLRLFKSKNLIHVTALSSFVSFGIIMCFYGLMLYAGILSGSIYLNGFLSSLTAIPSNIGAALIYRYLKSRKKPLVAVLSFAAISLILSFFNSFVKTETVDLVLTICSNIGMCLITASVCMILVYVAELFPSEIRSYGVGFVFAVANIGGIICPFVNDLDENLSHGSPMVIYSTVLILVVWSLNLLPDTTGDNISDFVEQKQQRQEDDENEEVTGGRTDSLSVLYDAK